MHILRVAQEHPRRQHIGLPAHVGVGGALECFAQRIGLVAFDRQAMGIRAVYGHQQRAAAIGGLGRGPDRLERPVTVKGGQLLIAGGRLCNGLPQRRERLRLHRNRRDGRQDHRRDR